MGPVSASAASTPTDRLMAAASDDLALTFYFSETVRMVSVRFRSVESATMTSTCSSMAQRVLNEQNISSQNPFTALSILGDRFKLWRRRQKRRLPHPVDHGPSRAAAGRCRVVAQRSGPSGTPSPQELTFRRNEPKGALVGAPFLLLRVIPPRCRRPCRARPGISRPQAPPCSPCPRWSRPDDRRGR